MSQDRTAPRIAFLAAAVLALLLACALGLPARASAQVVPLSLGELVANSEAIVEVRVIGTSASRVARPKTAPLGSPVVTASRLRVTRVLKGSRPDAFALVQPGGFAEGLGVEVSDVPLLRSKEHAILFLDAHGVVGGEQGRLDIVGGRVPALDLPLADAARLIRRLAGTAAPGAADDPLVVDTLSDVRSPESAVLPASAVAAASAATVTPAFGNAGVGERVSVVGSGFGSARGSVRFPAGNGGAAVTAVVDSWSDSLIVCAIPAGAGSGELVVRNSAGAEVAREGFVVGFSFTGHRASSPFAYRIHTNTADFSGEGAAISRALATWTSSGAKFAFSGTTAAGVPAFDLDEFDDRNDIFFVGDLTDQGLSAGYLAVNRRVYDGSGATVESDIYFNDAYNWGDGASSDYFDTESVALHELGHTLGLGDQYADYVFGEVMGLHVDGETRRALSRAEVDGARAIYGTAAGVEEPPPAEPEPAGLTLSSGARLDPAYGSQALVVVGLTDASGTPLPDRAVRLYDSQGGLVTTLAESGAIPGRYFGYASVVRSRAVFSVGFAGDGKNGPATTTVIVKPQVKLTVNAPETPRRDRTFYVSGTIAPAHNDAKITFEAWRRAADGSYSRYAVKSVTTEASTFRRGLSLPSGRWRFRTVHEDYRHSYSKSGWDYITVTK